MPAEWERHDATWIAWPFDRELWGEELALVQDEWTALARAITSAPPGTRAETLHVLVPDALHQESAERALKGLPVVYFQIPFGDIWLRDTAPLFIRVGGQLQAQCFQFNGWGGKYDLPGDDAVAGRVAEHFPGAKQNHDWILEGGSVEFDGQGTCLTTEQCLLNPNRNPGLDRQAIERRLSETLGARKVLWIEEGLLNDHTDGHIDTIARFVAPGRVVCMAPNGPGDPNARVLERIRRQLETMVDSTGRRLEVTAIPSPGAVTSDDGEILAASYVNFYIANHCVVVPTYGKDSDTAAVELLSRCFADRKVVGLSAKSILLGGGAFHCITQQQPSKAQTKETT